jgi:uncharacterized protein (TIGR03086 family)
LKFTVDDLTDHLIGSIQGLGAAAGGEIPDHRDGSRVTRVADAAAVALEAWRRRGIDGTVTLGSNEMPAAIAVGILSVELLVHAWDFAQATGQSVVSSDALGEYVLDFLRQLMRPEMRDGDRFAAEVEVGPDVDNLERLAGFTGRSVTAAV